jgi:hypothetical protein
VIFIDIESKYEVIISRINAKNGTLENVTLINGGFPIYYVVGTYFSLIEGNIWKDYLESFVFAFVVQAPFFLWNFVNCVLCLYKLVYYKINNKLRFTPAVLVISLELCANFSTFQCTRVSNICYS